MGDDGCCSSSPWSFFDLPSSFSSRRSHLDSATYRTLICIFSLCLDDDESLKKPCPQQNPGPSPNLISDSNANSKAEAEEVGHGEAENGATFADDSHGELPHDPDRYASSSQPAEESEDAKGKEEERRSAGGGIMKGQAFTNTTFDSLFDAEKQLELDDDEGIDVELLQCVMTDYTELIDASLHSTHEEAQNVSFGIKKEAREGAGQEIDIDADELKREEIPESFNVEAIEVTASEEKAKRAENVGELQQQTHQEACINSEPFASERFEDRSLSEADVDDEDFEEGEIPNDILGNPNLSPDFGNEFDNKLEEVSEGFNSNRGSVFLEGNCMANKTYSRLGSSSGDQVAAADVEFKAADPGANMENRKASATEVQFQ